MHTHVHTHMHVSIHTTVRMFKIEEMAIAKILRLEERMLHSRNQNQATAARAQWAEGRRVGDQIRKEFEMHIT